MNLLRVGVEVEGKEEGDTAGMIGLVGKEKGADWEIEEGKRSVTAAGVRRVGIGSAAKSAIGRTSISTTNLEVLSITGVKLESTDKCGVEVEKEGGVAMSIEWEEESEVQ